MLLRSLSRSCMKPTHLRSSNVISVRCVLSQHSFSTLMSNRNRAPPAVASRAPLSATAPYNSRTHAFQGPSRGFSTQRIAMELLKRALPYAGPAAIFVAGRIVPILAAVLGTAYLLYVLEGITIVQKGAIVAIMSGVCGLYYALSTGRDTLAASLQERVQRMTNEFVGLEVLMATDRVLYPKWNDEPCNLQPMSVTLWPSSSSSSWFQIHAVWEIFYQDADGRDYVGSVHMVGGVGTLLRLMSSPEDTENVKITHVYYSARKRTRIRGVQALDLRQDLSPITIFQPSSSTTK